MRTIWHSLAWKEWHEHKWKLAAIAAVLVGCVAMTFFGENAFQFSNIGMAILLPILPLSVLIASSTAALERSRGTLPFLTALPINKRQAAIAKLAIGLGTCLIPVLVAFLLLYSWYLCWDWLGVDYRGSLMRSAREVRGPFSFSNWFVGAGSFITLWVVSVYLWSAAAAVNRTDEVSAGAAALAVISGIWLTIVGIGLWLSDGHFDDWLDNHRSPVALAIAVAPGGFPNSVSLVSLGNPLALCVLGLFVSVHAGLAVWFVTQFGRDRSQQIKSNRAATSVRQRLNWLAPPWQSTLSAIAWKQFRESGPVVLAGLGGVSMIVVAGLIVTAGSQSSLSETKDVFATSAFFGCIYVGGFTTLVVGIGVFLRDLEPGIHTFWRSRPIEPNTWYWVKVTTGVAVVGLTFLLPMLILPGLASSNQFRDMSGESDILRLQMAAVAVFAAAYSIAVATTCLTRSAVYATVLTILGLYLGALMPAIALFVFRWLTSPTRPTFPLDGPEGHTTLLVGLILSAVVGTIVGWLSVRNDWGRKNR